MALREEAKRELKLPPPEILCFSVSEDEKMLHTLEQHLLPLQRQGRLIFRYPDRVEPGKGVSQTIQNWEAQASLILLLMSPAFLATEDSDRIIDRTMSQSRARVVPLIVRPCGWRETPLASLQCLPINGEPIARQDNQDQIWQEVTESLLQVLDAQVSSLTTSASAKQLWNIPFARNPFFTGREALLTQLHTQLQTMQTAALSQPQAVSGLGGVGKTQLAVEYAYRHVQEYRAVLWARAETTETLTASYVEFARMLNLPQQDAQRQDVIVQAVKQWLETEPGWLLVLDNADELNFVQNFLPPRFAGHLVLTTREQKTGKFARRLEVETLARDEGTLLLLRRAGLIALHASLDTASPSKRSKAAALAETLGDLPLALDQAGAYIEETQCGLADYERQYQTSRTELLALRGNLPDDHPEPVMTTWSLSFAKVEQTNPTAANVLRLCAFLAPDDIPEELLLAALQTTLPVSEKPEHQQGWFSRINQAVAVLRTYSLIKRNAEEKTFAIHRLVQVVLREAMSEDERHTWMQRTVNTIEEMLPGSDFVHWKECERYLPHAQECVQLAAGQYGAAEAQVWYWIGTYLLERYQIQEAGPYVQRAATLSEQVFGENDRNTSSSLDRMARWYRLQGKYDLAEPLYTRALAIREQQLDPFHPDTAASLNNLALLYSDQGKYDLAEPLYTRALAIREQQLGPFHPTTANSLNNLALLYHNQGKYDLAEPLYTRALAIREQQLGPSHPDTALSLNNLAGLYNNQGQYELAEPLYTRALAISEQHLGPSHPDTAASLNNLASLYHNQGKYDLAEPLFTRALAIREQQLGPFHPDTANSLWCLAIVAEHREDYQRAEQLYQRALSIDRQSLGPEHPTTQRLLTHYVDLLRTLGREADAEQLESEP